MPKSIIKEPGDTITINNTQYIVHFCEFAAKACDSCDASGTINCLNSTNLGRCKNIINTHYLKKVSIKKILKDL